MLALGVTFKDDRGKPVPLFDERSAPRGGDEAAARRAARSGYDNSLRRTLSREEFVYLTLISIFPVCVAMAAGQLGGLAFWPSALIGMAVGGLLGELARRARRRAQTARIRNALIRARLCASCGYSLAGPAPGTEGCTICPECGAAWRIGHSLKE